MFDDLRMMLLADWTPLQLIAMATAAVVALLMILFALKSRLNYLKLPELPELKDGARVDAAIVIPARNEAANIERAVKSFPLNPVVVVDDGSTDSTGTLAAQAGATVVEPPPLKKGFVGKPNACQTGAEVAPASEWILFVDADTWYEPNFLPSLEAIALKEQRQAASVFPRQECVTIAEKMIVPYAFALYFCGVSAENLNDFSKPAALANGQCMIFRRSAYSFIGGHKAVIRSVIEDVDLARLAKRHQLTFGIYRAEHLASVRMYDSFGAIWRGFSKNAVRFLTVNPRTGLQVVLGSIVMTSWLPVLLFLLYAGAWAAAALFAMLPILLFWPWYGSLSRAMLTPFAIYAFQAIALNALFRTTFGLPTSWKGRPV